MKKFERPGHTQCDLCGVWAYDVLIVEEEIVDVDIFDGVELIAVCNRCFIERDVLENQVEDNEK